MRRILRALGGGFDLPRPDATLAIIGDVHGRADLFARLLDAIRSETTEATVVGVGDYCDRGPESLASLRLARERLDVALLGNHEAMLLGFLDDPELEATRWLRVGGRETLASFGVEPPGDMDDPAPAATALREALGGLADWLRARPLAWRSGNVLVTHAGADPRRSPEDQDAHALLWGHAEFRRRRRRDGVWVVHGHTMVERPFAREGRIALDTGAYKTGVLTAAILEPGAPPRFLQVRDDAAA